jgi:peptidoglycan/LPS O-acetylase OafA/YrhL
VEPTRQHEYYERLQSFRGFGVLMVAFHHCQGVMGGALPLRPSPASGAGTAQVIANGLALSVCNGHAALSAFFVLSGFVLMLSLRRRPQGGLRASAAFVTARFFRIVPANAVAVLVAVGIAAATGAAPQARLPPPWDWAQIVANMSLLQTSINPVAWSLTVELMSVPFILALYFATRRWGPLPLAVAVVATAALSFAPRWIGYPPLGSWLYALLAGMLAAETGPWLVTGISRRWAAAWFSGAIGWWFLSRPLFGLWSNWASLAETGATTVLIALLVAGPELAAFRAFELRPILWLGELSYSVYLYHAMLWSWFAPSVTLPVFVRAGGWGPLAAVVVAWLVTVAAAVPVGWLSYEVVERAGIGAGRLLTRRLRAPESALAPRRAARA